MDRTLRAALVKLHGQQTLPASQFTAAQRSALDRFARQTGAVICQRQGRGDVYRVSDPRLFDTHRPCCTKPTYSSVCSSLTIEASNTFFPF